MDTQMDGLGRVGDHLRLVLLLGSLSTPAHGQSADSQDRASSVFDDAVRMMKADRCEDAIPLFVESQRLDPAAATLTNLATCYVRIGKTASAYTTYRQATRAAVLENNPVLQQSTDQAVSKLRRKLTHLKVVPLGTSELPTIRVNGQLPEDVREPIPLDPGENIIEATAPGRDPWRKTVSALGEGALLVVEVPDLRPPREPDNRTTPQQLQPQWLNTNGAVHRIDLKPYAIIATGMGAAGLAVGTVLAIGARSKHNASSNYCDGRYCTQPGMDLREQARDRAELATWSVGIGIVSLAAAAALRHLSTRSEQHVPNVSLHPWIHPGKSTAGIALEAKL